MQNLILHENHDHLRNISTLCRRNIEVDPGKFRIGDNAVASPDHANSSEYECNRKYSSVPSRHKSWKSCRYSGEVCTCQAGS